MVSVKCVNPQQSIPPCIQYLHVSKNSMYPIPPYIQHIEVCTSEFTKLLSKAQLHFTSTFTPQ